MKRNFNHRIYQKNEERVFLDYYEEAIKNLAIESRKLQAEGFNAIGSIEEITRFEYLEYLEPIAKASWPAEAIASMQTSHLIDVFKLE